MAGAREVQFDMFGESNDAATPADALPVLTAQGWQSAETLAFVAALKRGALIDSLAVLNRLKIDTAWKVLLEAGFAAGTTKSRAALMAPVQKALIEAAQRGMTGHELRAAKASAVETPDISRDASAAGKSRAIAGGQVGINGYDYKGGQFLPSTLAEPGRWKVGSKWITSGRELIEPGVVAVQPTPFSRSILASLGSYVEIVDGALNVRDGVNFSGVPITRDTVTRLGVNGVQGKEEITYGELIDAYNNGQRWFDVQPDALTITTQTTANDELGNAISDASLDRTKARSEVRFAQPYTGTTGAQLVGYAWPNKMEEYIDQRGEERVRTISDWEQAVENLETGRQIVHQFVVKTRDGKEQAVSAETAAVVLGISESTVRGNATKLLANEITKAKALAASIKLADAIDAINAPSSPAAAIEERATTYSLNAPMVQRLASNGRQWASIENRIEREAAGLEKYRFLVRDGRYVWSPELAPEGSELHARGWRNVELIARSVWPAEKGPQVVREGGTALTGEATANTGRPEADNDRAYLNLERAKRTIAKDFASQSIEQNVKDRVYLRDLWRAFNDQEWRTTADGRSEVNEAMKTLLDGGLVAKIEGVGHPINKGPLGYAPVEITLQSNVNTALDQVEAAITAQELAMKAGRRMSKRTDDNQKTSTAVDLPSSDPIKNETQPTLYRYALQNRPPSIGAVPKGFVSHGADESVPAARHGVIAYDRELTADEVKQYELVPLGADGAELQLPKLPHAVRRQVEAAVASLRYIADELNDGANRSDYEGDIAEANATLNTFATYAEQKGIDKDKALTELGGVPDFAETKGLDNSAGMDKAQVQGVDMEQLVKVAADSIAQLRKVDVLRVLESNRRNPELARYIAEKRPDLLQEVKEVMEDEFGIRDWMGGEERVIESAAVAAKPDKGLDGTAAAINTEDNRNGFEGKLRKGDISVEQFMVATGLTDDDVGFLSPNGLREQADMAAKKASPYHVGIAEISAAIYDAQTGLKPGSTPASRRAFNENSAKYQTARSTLDVIAKNYEHPFNNNLLSRLPPFVQQRFEKKWASIEHGDAAKRMFREDSYRRWVELLIDAAQKKDTGISKATVAEQERGDKDNLPPSGVYASMDAFEKDTAPFGAVAHFAAAMSGMGRDWQSHGKTLGEVLDALKPATSRDWQLEKEMSDPGFARTYRGAFVDTHRIIYAIKEIDAQNPSLRILEKVRGPWALDMINQVAQGGRYFGLSADNLKHYVSDSKAYAKVKGSALTAKPDKGLDGVKAGSQGDGRGIGSVGAGFVNSVTGEGFPLTSGQIGAVQKYFDAMNKARAENRQTGQLDLFAFHGDIYVAATAPNSNEWMVGKVGEDGQLTGANKSGEYRYLKGFGFADQITHLIPAEDFERGQAARAAAAARLTEQQALDAQATWFKYVGPLNSAMPNLVIKKDDKWFRRSDDGGLSRIGRRSGDDELLASLESNSQNWVAGNKVNLDADGKIVYSGGAAQSAANAVPTFQVMERGKVKTYAVDVESEEYLSGLSAGKRGFRAAAKDQWAAVRFHNYLAGYAEGQKKFVVAPGAVETEFTSKLVNAADVHIAEASRLMTDAIRKAGEGDRPKLRSAFWDAEDAVKKAFENQDVDAMSAYAKTFPQAYQYVQNTITAQQANEMPVTEHAGFKIYPFSLRGADGEVVPHWGVQSIDNRERERKGIRQVGGDALLPTMEAAMREAEKQVAQIASDALRAQEEDARAAEAEARKEANRGLSIAERKANSVLDKPARFPGPAGLGSGTVREAMDKAVEQGRAIVAVDVQDIAAKRRDEATLAQGRRAGWILGYSNANLPGVQKMQAAHDRLKENSYTKPEYRVYMGSNQDGGFFEISKTAYDYANKLKSKLLPPVSESLTVKPEMVVSTGTYRGKIVEVSDQHVIQDAGRGQLVAHERTAFIGTPTVDKAMEVGYKDGRMVVAKEMDGQVRVGMGR